MIHEVRRLPDDGGKRRPHQRDVRPQKRGEADDRHAELEAAHVPDEVLVVRAIHRHP
jgi:hypothetical protein